MNNSSGSAGRDSIGGGSIASGGASGNMRSNKLIRPAPSEIEYKNMKFLITDRPNDSTMATYVEVSGGPLPVLV